MNATSRCVLIGAGGHARVVFDCLAYMPEVLVEAVIDSDKKLHGSRFQGVVPVVGGDEKLAEVAGDDITHFVLGVGSVGPGTARQRLFASAIAAGLQPLTVRHVTAVVSPFARLEPGAQVLPGCVINAGAVIGANAIINSGAIVEHDAQIGAHAHIAPRACVAGAATIGEGAHIGAGAVVLQGRSVGAGTVVGAGAVVTKDLPAGVVAWGVPARVHSEEK